MRRQLSGRIVGLSTLIGWLLVAPQVTAAQAQDTTLARLTVRPHELATATRTAAAGLFPLDPGGTDTVIYVPPQCVGARRCPLVVTMDALGTLGLAAGRPVADKYGIILYGSPSEIEIGDLNTALQRILRTFAIDPDKLAIVGRSHTGPYATIVGGHNLDVFSRVVVISGAAVLPGLHAEPRRNPRAMFLVDAGFLEGAEEEYGFVPLLRRAGVPVKLVVTIREHQHHPDDLDFVGHWLQASWASPDPKHALAALAPVHGVNPVPVLTAEALRQMTTFWTRFLREPDPIKVTARQAQLHEVVLPIGARPPSTWMTDMVALAAKYPAVAADLRAAGLTAAQHDAYRVALLAAGTVRRVNIVANRLKDSAAAAEWTEPPRPFAEWRRVVPQPIPVEPGSVLARNVAFLDAHRDEDKALTATGIWMNP